jgi:molybdenum-pterin binding domain
MKLSVRNQLAAVVKEVVKGDVMAKVIMDYKGDTLVSVISVDSVKELDIKPGDKVIALIKGTNMMIAKE